MQAFTKIFFVFMMIFSYKQMGSVSQRHPLNRQTDRKIILFFTYNKPNNNTEKHTGKYFR